MDIETKRIEKNLKERYRIRSDSEIIEIMEQWILNNETLGANYTLKDICDKYNLNYSTAWRMLMNRAKSLMSTEDYTLLRSYIRPQKNAADEDKYPERTVKIPVSQIKAKDKVPDREAFIEVMQSIFDLTVDGKGLKNIESSLLLALNESLSNTSVLKHMKSRTLFPSKRKEFDIIIKLNKEHTERLFKLCESINKMLHIYEESAKLFEAFKENTK